MRRRPFSRAASGQSRLTARRRVPYGAAHGGGATELLDADRGAGAPPVRARVQGRGRAARHRPAGLTPVDFGIALAPGVDAWKVVERAERLGFSHAWFYDTQMLCADVFVAMALAAAHTSRIVLGTGVLVPSNRIAPGAANGLASLNRLAPGRTVFGVRTGFTARNTMGLGPMKLSDLREYVRVVQSLLRGETVEWAFEGARRKIRFLNPEAGLIDIA